MHIEISSEWTVPYEKGQYKEYDGFSARQKENMKPLISVEEKQDEMLLARPKVFTARYELDLYTVQVILNFLTL